MSSAQWRGSGTREEEIALQLYEQGAVKEAKRRDGNWSLTLEGGWGWGGLPIEDGFEIKVGDMVRVYGGFGRPAHGCDVNGVCVWWMTVEEEDEKHRLMVEEMHARHAREFIEREAKLDADYNGLPVVLQHRISALRSAGGQKWREANEPYEMFCCTQGVVLSQFESVEALDRWISINSDNPPEGYEPYDFKRQSAEAPEGYVDEHSGNTFGVACVIARILIENPNDERLVPMPAAMSLLSGDPRYQ